MTKRRSHSVGEQYLPQLVSFVLTGCKEAPELVWWYYSTESHWRQDELLGLTDLELNRLRSIKGLVSSSLMLEDEKDVKSVFLSRVQRVWEKTREALKDNPKTQTFW